MCFFASGPPVVKLSQSLVGVTCQRKPSEEKEKDIIALN